MFNTIEQRKIIEQAPKCAIHNTYFFYKASGKAAEAGAFPPFFGDTQSIALLRFIREGLQFIREGLLFIGEPPGDSISAEMDSQSSKNG